MRRLLGRQESIETISDEAFVDYCYDQFMSRPPHPDEKSAYMTGLAHGMTRAEILNKFIESVRFQTAMNSSARAEYVPAGHFGSVIPSQEDVAVVDAMTDDLQNLPGVDLRIEQQIELLESFKPYYDELPYLQTSPPPSLRYETDNPGFSVSDMILLNGMMRHFKPKRMIEIGCGFSSSVMLDTNEIFFDNQIEQTFVDPYPQLFQSLVKPEDERRFTLHARPVQDLPLSTFERLETNDILFIDSSHVSKAGSDVNYLFFDVLPRLKPGVVVHIHDIFYPLELPVGWMHEGRFWNEQYLLRAFLMFNASFEIL
ncbi:MAG: class I SAM-dependent methyltransferase, partial [Chloroflexota bacterium]